MGQLNNSWFSFDSKMGFDKDSAPRKPMLASRQIARAPLTPKIASTTATKSVTSPTAAAHGSNFLPQTVTLSSPYPRRTAGPAAQSTFTNQSHNDLNSYTSPFPNSVTPRSGPRQSRADSGHTTPNDSPVHSDRIDRSQSSHWDTQSGFGGERVRHASVSSASPLAGQGSRTPANNSIESKFFYAHQAKPATTRQQPSPPPLQRPPTFLYANGQSIPSPQSQQPHLTQYPSPQPNPNVVSIHPATPSPDLPSKFVYANGAPDKPHGPPVKGPAAPASVKVGSHSKSTTSPSGYVSPHQRPLSPVRAMTGSPHPLQRSGTLPVNARSPTSPPFSSPMMASASASASSATTPTTSRPDGLHRQRSSAGTTITSISGHSRHGSLTIADASAVSRILYSSQSNSETSPSSTHFSLPPQVSSEPTATGSNDTAPETAGIDTILQAYHDSSGTNDERKSRGSGGQLVDGVHSPTKHHDSLAYDHLDDLVTNARRDRKVQDLEITNASLEAINRSLERQLRKQKNELRNFRRLSRSGRLSMTPSMVSNRIVSSSTVEGPLLDNDQLLSGFSDEDLEDYDGVDSQSASDLDTSFHDDSDASVSDSPSSDVSSPALASTKRRRKREEKRIQLDLAKHRELLVDSQKINQSIKRCLSWTDELIEDGRKALAFQVRVSEIQIGGRVLAEDELGEELDENQEAVKDGRLAGDYETVDAEISHSGGKDSETHKNMQPENTRVVLFSTDEVNPQASNSLDINVASTDKQDDDSFIGDVFSSTPSALSVIHGANSAKLATCTTKTTTTTR